MRYLLDTNIFIESHKTYYNMNVFPCFWAKLIDLAQQGVVYTLDKVQQEIMAVGDNIVTTWFKANFPKGSILPVDDSTFAAYQKVVNNVSSRNWYYTPALAAFANQEKADAFLCAYAMSHLDFAVVSFEKSNPERKNKVMLPDVCSMEGVGCSHVIQMFLDLGVVF